MAKWNLCGWQWGHDIKDQQLLACLAWMLSDVLFCHRQQQPLMVITNTALLVTTCKWLVSKYMGSTGMVRWWMRPLQKKKYKIIILDELTYNNNSVYNFINICIHNI